MATDSGNDKRGLMMMAIAMLLLTVIGAGIGFAVGLVLQSPEEAGSDRAVASKDTGNSETHPAAGKPESIAVHDDTGGEDKAAGEETPDEPEDAEAELPLKDLKVVPFPPILTTLAEPKGKWIRLEGALLALPSTEKAPELLAEETGEQILAYLRTLRLSQIETPSGFLGLRDDLNETVKVMSDGQVRGVLIHGLVVE